MQENYDCERSDILATKVSPVHLKKLQASATDLDYATKQVRIWEQKRLIAQGASNALGELVAELYRIDPSKDLIEADGTIIRDASSQNGA